MTARAQVILAAPAAASAVTRESVGPEEMFRMIDHSRHAVRQQFFNFALRFMFTAKASFKLSHSSECSPAATRASTLATSVITAKLIGPCKPRDFKYDVVTNPKLAPRGSKSPRSDVLACLCQLKYYK